MGRKRVAMTTRWFLSELIVIDGDSDDKDDDEDGSNKKNAESKFKYYIEPISSMTSRSIGPALPAAAAMIIDHLLPFIEKQVER